MSHIFVAAPAYDGTVSASFCNSLLRSQMHCLLADVALTSEILSGFAIIEHVRNVLVQKFLDSSADTMLFIDADVAWDYKAVLKLYQSGLDVVGGAYPKKQEEEGYPVELLEGEKDGFYRAAYLPTGFLMIRRRVFEKLKDRLPSYRESFSKKDITAYFECKVGNGALVGEDVYFCHQWRLAGGDCWAYPNIDFEHAGFKSWGGNYQKFLNERK